MVNDIVRLFENKFPDREVELIADLGHSKYLVVAPGKGMGFEDSTNPTYSVDMPSGKIERFSIVTDMAAYRDAMGKILFEKER